MDIIRWSIERPVSVTVGVLLVVMFGLIALGALPVQLTPTVDRPIVTVSTNWPGRSPQEIVDEITKEQEERLKNVENLRDMTSTSSEGSAQITLEFYIGTDRDRALQEVSDALRQVPEYPQDVDEPVVRASDGASENAIAWIIIDVEPGAEGKHPDFDITTLFDALDKQVKPFIERIDGVAQVNILGGRPREVRVLVDPVALAQRGLSYGDLIDALRAENQNVSAGTSAEGKRDYRVRVTGQFVTRDDVLDTPIAWRDGKPVYVRDVAEVEFGYAKQRAFVRAFGKPSIAMNVIRQSGANVMDVMADVRARLDEVKRDILPRLHPTAGPDLRLRQVYDETTYIDSAIRLVVNNLWVGGALSAVALVLFLRSLIGVGLIALVIPISVIFTFLIMLLFGRTLNVISLAGLAFATGVVVDNATVVLENTYRRLHAGDTPLRAAYRGAREVWGAILASTLTAVAVFIPILTIQEEAGQLFRDISLAIAISVLFSLLVSITVIPSACARWVNHAPEDEVDSRTWLGRAWHSAFGLGPIGALITARLASAVHWCITGWRAWSIRPAAVVVLTSASLWASWMLMPPMDYLPQGNRNLVFGFLLIPPGYSLQQQEDIAARIEAPVKPYAEADINDPASVAKLPPIPRGFAPPGGGGPPPFDPVPVRNFFVVGFNGGMFGGATSQDEQKVIPVGQLLSNAFSGIPDAYGRASQASLFGRGIGGGNTVNIQVSGPNMERVTAAASYMNILAGQIYGIWNIRPSPSNYNLAQQEWRIRVTERGRELGVTTRDAGVAVRSLFDGAFVDDFRLGGESVDLVVVPKGGRLENTERLESIPVKTPAGPIVPLDSVVQAIRDNAPQSIQRIEELPAVDLQVIIPQGRTVEEIMTEVREKVIGPATAAGMIDSSMRIRLEGTAAKLDEVRASLFGAAQPGARVPGWRRGVIYACGLLVALGVAVAAYGVARAVRQRRAEFTYGGVGAVLVALVIAGLIAMLAWQPQLATARFIWALVVTYLLMCALFESFLYPFVIMFSVPTALVGGFAALRLVHDITAANPTIATQQLDVLTMLGFVMLIGTVVSNAILLVEQALNFMNPAKFGDDSPPLTPTEAIRESVRTRVRPIMMTSLTTVTGGLPLVLAPGAGSEMYRGLGAVVLGGLIVSTIFTLILVPLVFSLVMEMGHGLRALRGRAAPAPISLPARRDTEFGRDRDREPEPVTAV